MSCSKQVFIFLWGCTERKYIFFWQFERVSEVICALSENNVKVEEWSSFFKTFTQYGVLITQSQLPLSTHSQYSISGLIVNLSHSIAVMLTVLQSLNLWARSYLIRSWNTGDKCIRHVLCGAKWAFIIYDSFLNYIRGEEETMKCYQHFIFGVLSQGPIYTPLHS